MTRILCISLFLTLSLSGISRGTDTTDDAKSMNGTWLAATAEFAGEKFPDEVRKTIELVIDDGKYRAMVSMPIST